MGLSGTPDNKGGPVRNNAKVFPREQQVATELAACSARSTRARHHLPRWACKIEAEITAKRGSTAEAAFAGDWN